MEGLYIKTAKEAFSLNDAKSADNEKKTKEVLDVVDPNGIAKYQNPQKCLIHIIYYDDYVTKFPDKIRKKFSKPVPPEKGQICDLVVYSEGTFLLNELSATKSEYVKKKQTYAYSQLRETAKTLLAVPAILNFVKRKKEKCCIFFNQYPDAPPPKDIADVVFFDSFSDTVGKDNAYEEKIQEIEFRFSARDSNSTPFLIES